MLLLQILLQESISNEKAYSPFWTVAYKELSGKLLLPIEIASVGLDLNSSLKKPEAKSPFSTMMETSLHSKNSLTTYFQLSTSIVVSKWESEATKPSLLKSLKIKLKPNYNQRKMIDEWCNTSDYVYNKTVQCIREVYGFEKQASHGRNSIV